MIINLCLLHLSGLIYVFVLMDIISILSYFALHDLEENDLESTKKLKFGKLGMLSDEI